MSIAFVHLSDIHFGQEKGGTVIIHDDVKERLIEDVARVVKTLPEGRASGIIVSGDIVYGGKAQQYSDAGKWLDRVATAGGCAITDIQVVPGNHDIDLDKISHATALMLQAIAEKGEPELDAFLSSKEDLELLYARFTAYEPFAQAYRSPLDMGGGLAGDRTVELAPGRLLRFIGLNTALICKKKDEKGRLLLGARQRVLPRTTGEELVVIAHHPLRWLQDSDDARRYLAARGRVFITGHEHSLSVLVEEIKDGCDLMLIEAGATVPPTADGIYNYTYNVLEFEWDDKADGLIVTVHPRAWSDQEKDFEAAPEQLGGKGPQFQLGCPNFREAPPMNPIKQPAQIEATADAEDTVPVVQESGVIEARMEPSVPAKYSLLRLRFFRDLTSVQRLRVLVKLQALPVDWRDTLTHNTEVQILESMQRNGRLEDLESAIDEIEDEYRKQGAS